MTDKQVKDLIRVELTERSLAVTEQYLEIHEVIYENDEPKISRIDREDEDGLIIAYIPIKDEYFTLAVYINPNEQTIQNIGTESRNLVLLRAVSDKLTCHELEALTRLKSTNTINKGDFKRNKNSTYNYSVFEFEPNPEPDEFEDKLEKLLTHLEKDKEGLKALSKKSNVYISVTMDFHNGNQFLGSALISIDHVKRLSDLNLAVDLGFTTWGNPFK